jgi:hypothetical protein
MNIDKIIKDAGYKGDINMLINDADDISAISGDDGLPVFRALIAIAREAAAESSAFDKAVEQVKETTKDIKMGWHFAKCPSCGWNNSVGLPYLTCGGCGSAIDYATNVENKRKGGE